MNGWVLLHKKIWESDNFKYRKNKNDIILVWIWLLTHTNETGTVTCGREQIAKETGIHPSSIKRVFQYLRISVPEVTYKATKTYTEIHFCNWHTYQRKATNEVNHKRTTSEPQATTNKEIKNKEIKKLTNVSAFGNEDINSAMFHWKKEFGKSPPSKLTLSRYPLKRLIDAYTLDKVLGAITAVRESIDDKYAPAINNPKDLEDKWIQLVKFYQSKKQGVEI